ncbi:hypothetical protein [Chryseobacterium koreense]|uniref:GOLD domain-containing protein n=1 Tax=Chryseobacterium koreense CCUG 49689 TaxID=1304281 RepID=A0A0J7IWW8_9FLAO|nr:hypothetical protein [Chryseobacterium koreense]KMQ70304.1 hypothetical protein ACM44_12840 [Chryseobacterium koreense CCUG 49689]MBB5334466.1 putative nucleic acid-binding Zn-ribbon protein [Chryseobacterium koreense]
MKKLITILLMLSLVAACTTQKHKTKEKTKTETQKNEVNSISSEVSNETKAVVSVMDSTTQKTDYNSSKLFGSIAQHLTLKNNGKCADGGDIRFLKFTDAQGNKTEVPVNDNTEVNFNTAAELTAENKNLKTALSSLSTEKSDIETKLTAAQNQIRKYQESEKSTSTNIKTDIERSQLTAFIWCIVLTIVFWEAGKLLIRNRFKL